MSTITAPPAVEGTWPALHDAIHSAGYHQDAARLNDFLEANEMDMSEKAQTHSARDMTVLHTATNGNAEIVDLLVAHGAADVMEKRCGPGEEGRWSGFTALQMAAKSGNLEVARRLLAHGADFDIFSAVGLGDQERITELIDHDESRLNLKDDYKATLLHWAAACDQVDVAKRLLDRGANIDARDAFDESPLLVASAREQSPRSVVIAGFRFVFILQPIC